MGCIEVSTYQVMYVLCNVTVSVGCQLVFSWLWFWAIAREWCNQ